MRALKIAMVAAMFSTACACQTAEQNSYSVECKIITQMDGTKVEKCNEETVTEIIKLCMHDAKGQQYETEANDYDVAELLAMDPKNHEGPCK